MYDIYAYDIHIIYFDMYMIYQLMYDICIGYVYDIYVYQLKYDIYMIYMYVNLCMNQSRAIQ